MSDVDLAAAVAALTDQVSNLTDQVGGLHDCVHTQTAAVAAETANLAVEVRKNRLGAEKAHRSLGLRLKGAEVALGVLNKRVGTQDDAPGAQSVMGRLKRTEQRANMVERWWDRGKTAVWVAGPLIVFFAGVIWWLERQRIGALFSVPY